MTKNVPIKYIIYNIFKRRNVITTKISFLVRQTFSIALQSGWNL